MLAGCEIVGVFGMVLGVYYDSQESCAFIDRCRNALSTS